MADAAIAGMVGAGREGWPGGAGGRGRPPWSALVSGSNGVELRPSAPSRHPGPHRGARAVLRPDSGLTLGRSAISCIPSCLSRSRGHGYPGIPGARLCQWRTHHGQRRRPPMTWRQVAPGPWINADYGGSFATTVDDGAPAAVLPGTADVRGRQVLPDALGDESLEPGRRRFTALPGRPSGDTSGGWWPRVSGRSGVG